MADAVSTLHERIQQPRTHRNYLDLLSFRAICVLSFSLPAVQLNAKPDIRLSAFLRVQLLDEFVLGKVEGVGDEVGDGRKVETRQARRGGGAGRMLASTWVRARVDEQILDL